MRRSDKHEDKRRAAYPPEPPAVYPYVTAAGQCTAPYPPQNNGYTQDQTSYQPQNSGYSQSNSSYPPQSNGYSQDNTPYPPQNNAYPPQNDGYPPRTTPCPPSSAQPRGRTVPYPPASAPYPPESAAYRRQPPAYPPAYPPARAPWAAGGEPRKPRHTAFWTAIALICAACLALMIYGAYRFTAPYAAFRQLAAAMSQNTFAQGVMVDNVHIGGMTRAQAENALAGSAAAGSTGLNITVRVDNTAYTLTDSDIPFARNTAAVLDEAYAIGRQGSALTLNSDLTPLMWRYNHRLHVAQNGAYLYTQVTYDQSVVRALVAAIAEKTVRYPADAQVATFDFNTRAFTFTDEIYGATLDTEGLISAIVSALDRRDLTAVIAVSTTPLTPAVTKAELMNSFSRISVFTTETTNDANRNNNINLACVALSGTVLMPGETFSFNETTGERTAAKGYLPAAAIAGGTTIEEIGGGVCQVSSTLFNAAALADLALVYRSPHTWPSNYIEKGRDATVNWPNLDFKFSNSSDMPIFIVAYYQKRKCTVEIYGKTLGAGETIDLKTVTLSQTAPPAEPIYTQNPSLAPGTQQELKKARTGYVVETYRVYYHNGVEYKRDRLCTSTYKMIQQVIEFN